MQSDIFIFTGHGGLHQENRSLCEGRKCYIFSARKVCIYEVWQNLSPKTMGWHGRISFITVSDTGICDYNLIPICIYT